MQQLYKEIGQFMEIKPIKTEVDYQNALAEIEQLFAAKINTPAYECLEVLITLVEAYEKVHFPIDYPHPIEAILYYLESRELSIEDLQKEIGNKINIQDILNRKTALTLETIRQLHATLEISAEVLI